MLLTIILLIILGVDWASGYAIAGYVMRHGVMPNGYAFWQSCGPFLSLLIIQLIRSDVRPVRGGIKYSLTSGIFGIAIPNLMIYYAARNIDSGILTVIANIAPIFTYPLALLFQQEKFSITRLLLVMLGVSGISILFFPQKINTHISNLWLLLSLTIPLCYAFCVVYISRYKPQTGSVLNYALWMLFVSTIIVTPLTILTGEFYYLGLNYNTFLILLEIVLSTIGYVLLFIIIHRIGPVFFILVNAIASICGVFYAKFIFNQHNSNLSYIAVGIIVCAILGMFISYIQKVKNAEF
ncbi:MAG: DMT family transporter [Neisseriaceae bacterium]